MTRDPYAVLGEALAAVVQDAVKSALAERDATPTDQTEFLSVPEAASRLGLGVTTVKREIAAGRLESVLCGRRRLIPTPAVAEYAVSKRSAS